MKSGFLKVSIFTLVIIAAFVYVTELLTQISGGGSASGAASGVNPEAGEVIFWSKGKCFTCHSIGGQGSAIRCPNLGDSNHGPMIGIRAEERAKERAAATGKAYSPTDYLVESLADPGAHVVAGFKNEMPLVYQPPISLLPDEIKAVITYLQAQGGEPNPADIELPPQVLAAAAAPPDTFKLYIEGDPDLGRMWFYDEEGPAACAKCHTAIDDNGLARGGQVGPDLTAIAATRSVQYILESILDPSVVIASGYESEIIDTSDWETYIGVVKQENDEELMLVTSQSDTIIVKKDIIEERRKDQLSVMPANFADLITVQALHDILAYLLTLTGETAAGEDISAEE